MHGISMKSRIRLLLIVCMIFPLLTGWLLTGLRDYRTYRATVDQTINGELAEMKENMDVLMDSMKFMSYQVVNDGNVTRKLRQILLGSDDVQRVNDLTFLREQLDVYEISNPNINNISLFVKRNGGTEMINTTSLVQKPLPGAAMRLSRQNKIVYYGPHETCSIIGEYPVLSLMCDVPIVDAPPVTLYIESGYKRMDDFSARTLDTLGAVYAVVSDEGRVVFSSGEALLPAGIEAGEDGQDATLGGETFLRYAIDSAQGWSLQALVPAQTYLRHLGMHVMDFVLLAAGAAALAILLASVLGRYVGRPLRAFEEKLDSVMTDDVEAGIGRIHVEEFDRNFDYFETLKTRIAALVTAVQRNEQEKSELTIKQMLTKINPHFIHNTLYTLKWYADRRGYADVEAFVSSLSRLLMYNMEKDRQTTLRSELDAVRDYMALQRYKYDIEYEEALDLPAPMLDTELPRFILQPLAENAILHGVEGRGRIRVRASLRADGRISLLVANDGHPIDAEHIERILRSARDLSSNGIGVQYVVRMLEMRFPGAFELNVRNDAGESGVELVIPFNKGAYYAKDADR